MIREEWLSKAIEELRPDFVKAGSPLPEKIRVSVGFPGGRGPKRDVIGQCWPVDTVEDNTPAVFISPVLKDPVTVLGTLVHELVHSVGRTGHRKEFSSLAAEVGLVKPWRSTGEGPELKERLKVLAEQLGEYDHGQIKTSSIIRQTTRLLKVQCPVCDYTARITRKWLDVGLPSCPDGDEMEEA
jgi:hypothetical protein